MKERITVEHIDGFLRCLDVACRGCDYVPFYGAKTFVHDQASIADSLYRHFGLPTVGSFDHDADKNTQKIQHVQLITESSWRKALKALLQKWVDARLFEGLLLNLDAVPTRFQHSSFLADYADDLIEQIDMLTNHNATAFTARLNANFDGYGVHGYDCDIIGFVSQPAAFFLHFAHSD